MESERLIHESFSQGINSNGLADPVYPKDAQQDK